MPGKLLRRRPKVRSARTLVDGIEFDSAAEARRYAELVLLQRSGRVRALQIHPVFRLVVNGVQIRRYTADFAYEQALPEGWRYIVEDVKSRGTKIAQREWPMVKRLMLALHGIQIVET